MRYGWLLAVLVVSCSQASDPHVPVRESTPSVALAPTVAAPIPASSGSPATGGRQLAAIQRLNGQVGYLSILGGPALAKTRDNGKTWQSLNIPLTWVPSIRFIDETVGWVAGFAPRPGAVGVGCADAAPQPSQPCRGAVLRTVDGGQTWSEVLTVPTDGVQYGPIRFFQAVDGLSAWAVVASGSGCGGYGCYDVRRTVDGGRTWATLPVGGDVVGIRFASAAQGWVALETGANTTIVRTTYDGGSTWTTGFRAPGTFEGLDAASANRAWVMTSPSGYCSASNCQTYELFRTDDGGATWADLGNVKDSAGACSFGLAIGPLFASPGGGWIGLNHGAGGAGSVTTGLLESTDAGSSWRCLATPTNVVGMTAANPEQLWISTQLADESSQLYTTEDGGATWRAVALP